jgi:hypothetical protein
MKKTKKNNSAKSSIKTKKKTSKRSIKPIKPKSQAATGPSKEIHNLSKNKLKFNWVYAAYTFVILVFLISIATDSVLNASAKEGSGSGCNCDSITDSCNCDACGCEKDKDDDGTDRSEDVTDNLAGTQAPTVPTEPPCTPVRYVYGTIDNNLFSYSFAVTPCSSTNVDIVLKAKANTAGQDVYLYQTRTVESGQTLSGSGRRYVGDNIDKICMSVNGGQLCCSNNGRMNC